MVSRGGVGEEGDHVTCAFRPGVVEGGGLRKKIRTEEQLQGLACK